MRALVVALALFVASPAIAAYRITFDPGGLIMDYIEKYRAIADIGGRVQIDGPCISACTLVLAIVPPEQVCVTWRARLAFHSATSGAGRRHDSEWTRLAWTMYPQRVRELLLAKGWNGDDPKTNEHSDLIWIEGDELRSIYQECV